MSAAAELRLGFDIGGTKVALAVGSATGEILARVGRPTAPSGNARDDVDALLDDARRLLAELGASPSDLCAVGAAVPGPFDPVRGLLLNPPNLPGWRDVPVRDWLAEGLGCSVALENDANAAALAEWRFGAGRANPDCSLVYLTMSTGVGAGLVLGGRIHRGVGAGAGEVGHIPVEWDGDPCQCGQRGCLEAYVGGAAWTERLRRVTPSDSQAALRAGGIGAVRPEHLVRAAREGDAFAKSEFARFNDYLSRAIVGISFALDPDVIVLGTIATAAGEDLCFAPLRELVRARLWPDFADRLRIEATALGEDLPYRAALCAAG